MAGKLTVEETERKSDVSKEMRGIMREKAYSAQ
jgi:hypothetical protein